jgi:hypothetical protein
MKSLLWRTLGAAAACLAFYFATRTLLGPVVWVLLALLIGISFSRIVIDASAELGWQMRASVLDSMSGTHYQYQTWRLQVWEDERHCRCVPVDDVRKIVGHLASDATLAHLYPEGCQSLGQPIRLHLRDDALLIHLAQAPSARSIKFKNWAERNIAFPARKVRERLGIRIESPSELQDR